ncbi:sigma factor [Streptomyces telluris]|uniref:sigma factor n=1 Tax=Streptomyces telluris TaxID=2720021 RepID=UPI00143C905E|nr:hypothetical protein [Streptomyces telluris]
MAERISRGFLRRGENAADLRQIAAVALLSAVEAFDPALGHAFPTHAVPGIRGALLRHFRDFEWGLRVPRSLQLQCVSTIDSGGASWCTESGSPGSGGRTALPGQAVPGNRH